MSPASEEATSQRADGVSANKPGTRSIGGKAIVIELSGLEDEDDDHEDAVPDTADEGAAPAPHLYAEMAQDTPAPEAAASRKRKSERTSSASSSLPSSWSLSEFRRTPEWLKNRDEPERGDSAAEEMEKKREENKMEKEEKRKEKKAEKEEKRKGKEKKKTRSKKAKRDEQSLQSEEASSQVAGERPPRVAPLHTQDTGYITSAPLPYFEDPDPTPAAFWQNKASGVEDWLKNVE